MQNELQSFQNAADNLNLMVHEKYFEDKRKTTKKYFLRNGNATVSPVLDYNTLNHFILGWITGSKQFKAMQNI